jgi:hypothetical protein
MSNVIEFLERMGADAAFRFAAPNAVERAAAEAQIDGALRAAIVRGDADKLSALVGARENVCCIVAVPSDGEDEDEGDDKKVALSAA